MIYNGQKIRILIEITDPWTRLTDAITGAQVRVPRGVDLRFEICLAYNGILIDNFSNVAAIMLTIKSADREIKLGEKQINGALIDASTTIEDWQAGTKQHCVFEFANAETGFEMSGAKNLNLWIAVHGITNDSPAKRITYGAGTIVMEEEGVPDATTPPAPIENFYTAIECDGKYAQKNEANAGWRWKRGRWQIYDERASGWRPIHCLGGSLVLGDTEQ